MTPVLEVRGARKTFGAVNALAGVDVTLAKGEVLALLGDNGAGKSTLVKAISGVYGLDGGEILVDGVPQRFRSPADARALGIETVYQDLAVFDNLNARANLFLGREPARPSWLGPFAFLRERAMAQEWEGQISRLKVSIPRGNQSVGVMSGGQRQGIAVARAAAFASRIAILDEPTAALGIRESQQTLELIRRLPDEGISVVVVSHNLDHVERVADRAVVLRGGRKVGEAVPSADNHEAIVSMIVGAVSPATEASNTSPNE